MNVLIASEPGESGVFTYVEALSHYLIDHGVRVHLCYSGRRGSDRLDALVAHVRARGGKTSNMDVGHGVGPGDLRAFARLWRLAREVRPDVIHCHSSKAGALGRALAFVGVRSAFVYQPHAYFGMRPGLRPSGMGYELIEAVLGRIGTTIVVSSDERSYAINRLRLPPHRLKFIANGVDPERFSPVSAAEKLALRDAFGLPRDAVVLGAMSRLSEQKDPLTLYRAFAAASARAPGLHLFHVGSGDLEPQVAALSAELGIGGRVTRLGYLTDPTGFYRCIDGFILTSTYEGLSLASLEAMAADLPLVLSRAPGNIDLVRLPLTHVWSAEPGDVPGFASAIGLWHDSARAGAAPNHRAFAIEHFHCRNAQASVLSHYGMVSRRPGRGSAAWAARLPALIWLALIGFESTDLFSRAHTRRLFYPFFHFLTGVSYADFAGWNQVGRKIGHLFLYGTLSALLYRLARFQGRRGTLAGWSPGCAALAVLGTSLVASLDEWHQTTVPSRTGTVADVILDTCGGIAAQAILFAALSLSRRGGAVSAQPPAGPQSPPTPPTLPGRAG